MSYSERPLFGGAITSYLPREWKDLSDIQEVPDHQEVFQDSFVAENPFMLVIEIVERQGHIEDSDAALFFFNELAEQNDVLQTENDIRFRALDEPPSATALLDDASIVGGENKPSLSAGCGYQKVAMGRDYDNEGHSRRDRQEIKCVRVDLCVLRFPEQETDLLVTISRPVENSTFNQVPLETSSEASGILSRIISTLRIRNWELFG